MVRVDSTLGTASTVWRSGRPVSAQVLWTKGPAVLRRVDFIAVGDSVHLTGDSARTWSVPTLPWAIADYGMEDQVLPLLKALDLSAAPVTIAVYRPFAAQWDTLSVARSAVDDAELFELRSSTGKRDWWLVSARGVLLQLRREGQDFERRPLEATALFPEYLRLRALLPPN
jgi:hypothetical protein